jgi:hypothetical protein
MKCMICVKNVSILILVIFWCQMCESKNFQQNFKNWTSGNHDVDGFIQKAQLKAKKWKEILEWIDYDKFKNVEYLSKGDLELLIKQFEMMDI